MALVGTGPIITTYGNEYLDIGAVPKWYTFDVDGQAWDFSAEPTETGVLCTLPSGTIVIDALINCIKAAAATGTDTLDLYIALDGGDQVFWTGTSDNGGTIDKMDRGVNVAGQYFPVAEAVTLEVLRTISADTGTNTTGPASYRVSVLMFRPTRPTDTIDD